MAKKFRVGIVGGGQLAKMLGEGAKELGLEPVCLANSSAEPGYKACRGSFIRQPGDAHPTQDFLSSVEVAAFENEFFDDEIVRQAGSLTSKFRPSLETISIVRDKLQQKRLLEKLGVRTAPFVEMAGGPAEFVKQSLAKFGGAAAFKWATGGYDGKGVCLAEESNPASVERAAEFCSQAKLKGTPVFAEQKIQFERELALVAVRGTDGYFMTYPLVISEAIDGVCKWIKGPARNFGVALPLEAEAVRVAGRFAVESKIVGTFAVEYFVDAKGQLWVNEIAPRVHNSGHFTQEAAETSQFVNHWQAILGGSLGDTTVPYEAFAMVNLLGPSQEIAELLSVDVETPENVFFHDYGKASSKPGRKLGHVNGFAETAAEMPELLEKLRKVEAQWLRQVTAQAKAK